MSCIRHDRGAQGYHEQHANKLKPEMPILGAVLQPVWALSTKHKEKIKTENVGTKLTNDWSDNEPSIAFRKV